MVTSFQYHHLGPIVTEEMFHRPFTLEVRNQYRGDTCGICGGQSDTEASFAYTFPLLLVDAHLSITSWHNGTV
jgi:hypothetical protein